MEQGCCQEAYLIGGRFLRRVCDGFYICRCFERRDIFNQKRLEILAFLGVDHTYDIFAVDEEGFGDRVYGVSLNYAMALCDLFVGVDNCDCLETVLFQEALDNPFFFVDGDQD